MSPYLWNTGIGRHSHSLASTKHNSFQSNFLEIHELGRTHMSPVLTRFSLSTQASSKGQTLHCANKPRVQSSHSFQQRVCAAPSWLRAPSTKYFFFRSHLFNQGGGGHISVFGCRCIPRKNSRWMVNVKKLFATHPQPTHTLAAAYSAAAGTTWIFYSACTRMVRSSCMKRNGRVLFPV